MAAERTLLDPRLVIVTGKGGTGKTTVAATLARAAARAGKRVLVAEVGPDEHVPRLFETNPREVGYAGRELRPGLHAARIDPFEALAEYLTLQIGVRTVVDAVIGSAAFRQLLNAAPGWRELITLGKIWHLEGKRDAADAPLYDLIVVDAPATGHGLTFLDVPRVVVSAVHSGPLRKHAHWVEEMVADHERTLLLPVTLAEELPVRETAELLARARESSAIAIDRVVVNGLVAAPFPPDLEHLDTTLESLPRDACRAPLPPPRTLAACARHLRARHALGRHYAALMAELAQLPIIELPYLPRGVRGQADLAELADSLLGDDAKRSAA